MPKLVFHWLLRPRIAFTYSQRTTSLGAAALGPARQPADRPQVAAFRYMMGKTRQDYPSRPRSTGNSLPPAASICKGSFRILYEECAGARMPCRPPQFVTAYSHRASRRTEPISPPGHVWPGLVFCRACGHAMVHSFVSKKNKRYLWRGAWYCHAGWTLRLPVLGLEVEPEHERPDRGEFAPEDSH